MIVDEYAQQDSRFWVFHKSNGGLGSARNFALKKIEDSDEEFLAITFLDSDDWLEAHAYEELVAKMSETCSDILYFGYKRAYPEKVTETRFPYVASEMSRQMFTAAVFFYEEWKGQNGSWGGISFFIPGLYVEFILMRIDFW